MKTPSGEPVLVLADRPVVAAADRIRRYCGLPWSGGAPETWAFRYYDAVRTDPGVVGAIDVLTTAALHPGLSRADLAFFTERADLVSTWLGRVPRAAALAEPTEVLLGNLVEVTAWPDAPSLTLLSKVLHRARPHAVPLVDRHVLDWYRPVTGQRTAIGAWPGLLRALADDLATNEDSLELLADMVEAGTGIAVSHLRLIDIAIWMGSQR